MKVLFLDTETTGLINKKIGLNYATLDQQPYIVQLSYVIINTENYEMTKIVDNVVKLRNGISISDEASKIHGITNEISQAKGHDVSDLLKDAFQDITSCDMVVCHNTDYDIQMLKIEVMRLILNFEVSPDFQKILSPGINNIIGSNKLYCTMKNTVDLCKIERQNKRGSYFKYPTLLELHKELFGSSPTKLHNSLNDVLITIRCYFKLQKQVDICDVNSIVNEKIVELF